MDTKFLLLTLSEWMGVIAVVMLLSLSKRYKYKPVGFLYPRREGIVALSLFLLTWLLNYLLYNGSLAPAIKVANDLQGVWPRLVAAGLSLLLFGITLIVRRQPLRSAGWMPGMFTPALRAALTLSFLVIILRGQVLYFLKGFNTTSAMLLLAWIGTALAEETIFRGYIQLRLSDWIGNRAGWVATALLFTLWNIPRLMATHPGDLWLNAGLTLVNALVLGWVMQKSGHVLAPGLYRAISEWLQMIV
jgi:membrane protease YdiL (CAAX protease family)